MHNWSNLVCRVTNSCNLKSNLYLIQNTTETVFWLDLYMTWHGRTPCRRQCKKVVQFMYIAFLKDPRPTVLFKCLKIIASKILSILFVLSITVSLIPTTLLRSSWWKFSHILLNAAFNLTSLGSLNG